MTPHKQLGNNNNNRTTCFSSKVTTGKCSAHRCKFSVNEHQSVLSRKSPIQSIRLAACQLMMTGNVPAHVCVCVKTYYMTERRISSQLVFFDDDEWNCSNSIRKYPASLIMSLFRNCVKKTSEGISFKDMKKKRMYKISSRHLPDALDYSM